MPAFDTETELFDYFRRNAIALGCNPCFDNKQDELHKMNEKGRDGKPGCLCMAVYVECPCPKGKKDVEEVGICHCEIFKEV